MWDLLQTWKVGHQSLLLLFTPWSHAGWGRPHHLFSLPSWWVISIYCDPLPLLTVNPCPLKISHNTFLLHLNFSLPLLLLLPSSVFHVLFINLSSLILLCPTHCSQLPTTFILSLSDSLQSTPHYLHSLVSDSLQSTPHYLHSLVSDSLQSTPHYLHSLVSDSLQSTPHYLHSLCVRLTAVYSPLPSFSLCPTHCSLLPTTFILSVSDSLQSTLHYLHSLVSDSLQSTPHYLHFLCV